MISVITPTYNEKENIVRFIEKITSCLTDMKQSFEIIVVDDSSPDSTAEIVASLKSKYPHVSFLKRLKRGGIGSAYFDGFSKAKGDILIGIDADLSPSVESIPLLIEKLKEGNDMVIGSRYLPASKVYDQSPIKLAGSKLFNILIKFVLGIPCSDITHSYRTFTKKTFNDIKKYIVEKDHPSFFIEYSFWVIRRGYKISEVPIIFRERKFGYSKLNSLQGLKNAVKTLVRLKRIK